MTSPHGERDRMLPPPDMPRYIECSCGRRVDAEEVAICQVCDRVLCVDCAREFELETRCCQRCIVAHCDALGRERHLALLEQRIAEDWSRVWNQRYRSMLRLASMQMFVIAALVIFIFCSWGYR